MFEIRFECTSWALFAHEPSDWLCTFGQWIIMDVKYCGNQQISLLYFQGSGRMDPWAGEAKEELGSFLDTRGLHSGPDGRAAGRSCRLGQDKREEGSVEVTRCFQGLCKIMREEAVFYMSLISRAHTKPHCCKFKMKSHIVNTLNIWKKKAVVAAENQGNVHMKVKISCCSKTSMKEIQLSIFILYDIHFFWPLH